jgi:hypothetical protein
MSLYFVILITLVYFYYKRTSWGFLKFIQDAGKEKKIKSLEIKKNVKKEFKNINNPVTKKNFDIWKVIIKEFKLNRDPNHGWPSWFADL